MRIFAFVACITALAAPPQTPRDTPAAPITGSGVISGRIVTDDASARPVRQALLTLTGAELSVTSRTAASDDQGRFVFSSLPAGHYQIYARKSGYVPVSYGQRTPGRGSGVPITLANGQTIADLAMRIQHGGVITGTIRNASGRPAADVQVEVLGVRMENGARVPGGVASIGSTDDRGIYRIFSLAAGDYFVQARGAFGAQLSNVHRTTQADVDDAEQTIRAGAAAAATGESSAGTARDEGTTTYTTVFFPGVVDPAEATPITIKAGEEHGGADFSLVLAPASRIEGTVLNPDGTPASAGTVIRLITTKTTFGLDFPSLIRSQANGKFSAGGVTSGEYEIFAQTTGAPAGRGGNPSRQLWASEDVTINGRDITGMTLHLRPGMQVSGRIVFDGDSTPPDPTHVRVNVSPAPANRMSITISQGNVFASADGTFTVDNVLPGTMRLNATLGPGTPTWVIKSIAIDGTDVTDHGFDVRPDQDVSDVVVTLTDRATVISGMLQDAAGKPAPGYQILVFTADKSFWSLGSRRIKQVTPANDGKFSITGLPQGDYYLAAVTELEPNQAFDADFLGQLVPAAVKITLADGEKKVQDVRIAGGHER